MAGAINLALFDKTGTLTEDKFDFVGVLENDFENKRFQELRKNNFRHGGSREILLSVTIQILLVTDDQHTVCYIHHQHKSHQPL